LDSLIMRSVLVWAFLRFWAMVGTAMDPELQTAGIAGPLVLALLVDPIVVLVLFVDLHRQSEILFLANLGRSFRGMTVLIIGTCLLLETALRLAVG